MVIIMCIHHFRGPGYIGDVGTAYVCWIAKARYLDDNAMRPDNTPHRIFDSKPAILPQLDSFFRLCSFFRL